MKSIIGFLTLMVMAVLVIGLVTNAAGTAKVINAGSDFLSRGFAAELGLNPLGNGGGGGQARKQPRRRR